MKLYSDFQLHRGFVVVQLLSGVRLFVTPWTAACKPTLSITISWSLLKFMSIELVMSSKHFVLCHPLLFLPSMFPSNRVFFLLFLFFLQWVSSFISGSQDIAGSASASVLPMDI